MQEDEKEEMYTLRYIKETPVLMLIVQEHLSCADVREGVLLSSILPTKLFKCHIFSASHGEQSLTFWFNYRTTITSSALHFFMLHMCMLTASGLSNVHHSSFKWLTTAWQTIPGHIWT